MVHQGHEAMTLDEFRSEMEAYRQAANEEANEFKHPYIALDRLFALYRKFDAEERAMADEVLTDWVLSENENTRFDALALIREFRIITSIPALQQLAKRLASSRTPGAPHRLEKVNRLIADLSHDRGTSRSR
jgi:hypothetical protein